MPASELIERVASLIAEVGPTVPGRFAPELRALDARLREPARVAVVGPVKAGKSTLVNALLGQQAAPTGVGECTQVVTWFRYGHPQRMVIRLRDGSEVDGQLTASGMLPAELGVPMRSVAAIDVYLANETLRGMTLIDTPGLGSAHSGPSQSTQALLGASRDSASALARADAVLFLINHAVMADHLEALKLFGGEEDGAGSAANAMAVLSRADQLDPGGGDLWEVAIELAGHYATICRNQVSTVVPVIGLLAETAEAAVLTEMDVKNLRTLAGLDPVRLDRLLWSPDRFVTGEAPVAPDQRERLFEILDLYGVARAVGFVRDGVTGATALRRELSQLSGIAEVKHTLMRYFHEQDHVLKVRSALEALWRISFSGSDPSERPGLEHLKARVEALRHEPVMQPVAELEVWHDCCTGRIAVPDALLDEMRRLFLPGPLHHRVGAADDSFDAIRRAASDGMARWRTFMVTDASATQARVARVVLRSYQIAWETAA